MCKSPTFAAYSIVSVERIQYMLVFVSISNVTVAVFPSPKYFKEIINKIIAFFSPVLPHLKWIWAVQAKPSVIYYSWATLHWVLVEKFLCILNKFKF